MRTMKIGKSEIEASVVGMGAWAIGSDVAWGNSDDAESIRAIGASNLSNAKGGDIVLDAADIATMHKDTESIS